MEKSRAVHVGPCKAYACFEEPETLNILNFLEVSEGRIKYRGAPEEQVKKHKNFDFESISFLTEKLVILVVFRNICIRR